MNTADRSIALLDIALRRRFEFREIAPEYDVIDQRVEGVHLGQLLRAINNRLEFLADRDRLIGHSYFMRVRSLHDLREVFLRQVRSEEHTSELQSLMRISYADFCLKKKKTRQNSIIILLTDTN